MGAAEPVAPTGTSEEARGEAKAMPGRRREALRPAEPEPHRIGGPAVCTREQAKAILEESGLASMSNREPGNRGGKGEGRQNGTHG
jgi:hypothetical protein